MTETQILVVEDEIIVAEDIKRSLQNMGYDVPSVVSSGEAAIKKAGENDPDLVLMDIMLKGDMDGVTAAGIIRSRFNIPVVYLTAYSDNKILERAKITEPFGYIIKPFNERELAVNIEIALYKHKMENILRDSKEWYYVTLRSISDAVIATDPKGCVLFMNPVAQEITGWMMDQAQKMPLKEVFNIAGEGDQTILTSKDKTKIPIHESSDTIRDEKGNIIGIVIVFRRI
ncbi:MAG: response regulator [Candidatus Methanoperedens sp.]|nr:response regulator [Candidatus Methanoperedens sp.]MCE8427227.1 response regulator [Candidatus Methanoperedens sp.]